MPREMCCGDQHHVLRRWQSALVKLLKDEGRIGLPLHYEHYPGRRPDLDTVEDVLQVRRQADVRLLRDRRLVDAQAEALGVLVHTFRLKRLLVHLETEVERRAVAGPAKKRFQNCPVGAWGCSIM